MKEKHSTLLMRMVSLAIILSLLLSPSIQVSAASGASKKPSATINGFFNAVKQYKPDEMAKYADDNAHYTFIKGTTKSGKNIQQLIRKIHSEAGYNWKIKKIYTKGSTGYATVRIQYYDAYGHYFNGYLQLLKWALDNPFSAVNLNSDSDAIVSKVIGYTYDDFRESYYSEDNQNIEVITVKIPLKKIKGKWYIDKISKHLNYSTTCRISKASSDMKW